MGRVQIQLRVPEEVRASLQEEAGRRGVSVNAMLEEMIRSEITVRAVDPIEGQITVEEVLSAPDPVTGLRGPFDDGAPEIAFAPDCVNRAYHWKQGPGKPCRFCGGTRA